ncbi:MAG TPA: F0F1 ATP synthase subunit epsilon [Clostridia bacterium]|nr:F0F1 ATP synthase subunit epsilon [Clostridia bacterium]
MKPFYAELIAPDKVLFEGEIISLSVTALDGKVEILASHIPALCVMDTGKCKITLPDNSSKVFITEGGILNIKKDKVVITCDILEWEEDYEQALASRATHLESGSARRNQSYKEYKLGTVALRRTFIKPKP